jgi:hypothetical protein
MTLLRRIAVWTGGTALLAATAVDTLAVVGRNVGLPLVGSIELVQAAVLVAGVFGLIFATAGDDHARVRILTDRLGRLRRLADRWGLFDGAVLRRPAHWVRLVGGGLVERARTERTAGRLVAVPEIDRQSRSRRVHRGRACRDVQAQAAMIYATPATGFLGLLVLFALILGGVRIGAALGLVGMGGLAVVLGPEAAVIKAGVITSRHADPLRVGHPAAVPAHGTRVLLGPRQPRHVRRGGAIRRTQAGRAGLCRRCRVRRIRHDQRVEPGDRSDNRLGRRCPRCAGAAIPIPSPPAQSRQAARSGQMIPPSGALIVYGIIAQTSIGELFTAAIIPGLSQALFYCVVIWLLVRWQPALAPAIERSSWSERWQLAAPHLGHVRAHRADHRRASPSAGSARLKRPPIGAAGSLLIAALRKGLSRTMLFSAFEATLKTSGMIFLIIIGALVFSVFIGVTGLAEAASFAVTSLGLGPWGRCWSSPCCCSRSARCSTAWR